MSLLREIIKAKKFNDFFGMYNYLGKEYNLSIKWSASLQLHRVHHTPKCDISKELTRQSKGVIFNSINTVI